MLLSQVPYESYLIYHRVANQFASVVEAIFESEATLTTTFQKYYTEVTPFDRTDHWNNILTRELRTVWDAHGFEIKMSPTPFDLRNILHILGSKLDYNLFSQVLLNLTPAGTFTYRRDRAEAKQSALQATWAGKSPSPFDPKPKMFKVAATEEQQAFNSALSSLKALNIISKSTPTTSFRVSPKGSTPALVDSQNLSMLGAGADQFLQVPSGFTAFYITWDKAPEWAIADDGKPDSFTVNRISNYRFESKSGGEILGSALFSRFLAAWAFRESIEKRITFVLPRMSSVLVLAQVDEDKAPAVFADLLNYLQCELASAPVTLEGHLGVRREKALTHTQG